MPEPTDSPPRRSAGSSGILIPISPGPPQPRLAPAFPLALSDLVGIPLVCGRKALPLTQGFG